MDGEIIGIKRTLGFLESEKKMVACPYSHFSFIAGAVDHFYGKFHSRAVYLYTFLKEDRGQKTEDRGQKTEGRRQKTGCGC